MENTTLTQNEKNFIIAYYHSVADTLNYSLLEDIHRWREGKDLLSLKQYKGVLGSLVKKGLFENYEGDYIANSCKFNDTVDMDKLAQEFGYSFDPDDLDYDYLTPLTKV